MKWLLSLYPSAWRRRYRREVEAHLEAEPFRFGTVASLLAGAVDAWMYPQWIPEVNEPRGGTTMDDIKRFGSLVFCEGEAPRSAGLMIGISLFITVIAVALDKIFGDHIAIQALLISAFFIALTLSAWPHLRRELAPYSLLARGALVLVTCVCWYGFFLGVMMLASLT